MNHNRKNNIYSAAKVWEHLHDMREIAGELTAVIVHALNNGPVSKIYAYDSDGFSARYAEACKLAGIDGENLRKPVLVRAGWKQIHIDEDGLVCYAKDGFAVSFSTGDGYTPSQIYVVA